MKRVIAILLAVALVVGGLGNFAYAITPVNTVHVNFQTRYNYGVSGDSFTNAQVTGNKDWSSGLRNVADTDGPVVTDAALTLAAGPTFDWTDPPTPGPPYQWSFGNVPEGWEGVRAEVGFHESPVTYTPGFDVSRSATPTVFSGPGTQTLTVTVIPRNPPGHINIDVRVSEDEHVIPNYHLCGCCYRGG